MVAPARLERAAFCLGGRRSIHLSYEANHQLPPDGYYGHSVAGSAAICRPHGISGIYAVPLLGVPPRRRSPG